MGLEFWDLAKGLDFGIWLRVLGLVLWDLALIWPRVWGLRFWDLGEGLGFMVSGFGLRFGI